MNLPHRNCVRTACMRVHFRSPIVAAAPVCLICSATAAAQTLALPHPSALTSADSNAGSSADADITWGKSTHTNQVPVDEDKRPPSSDYSTKSADILAVEAYNSTYMPLFQRALLPGPAGSMVAPQTSLPIYDYMMFRVVDADMPWAKNSADMELSLWLRGSRRNGRATADNRWRCVRGERHSTLWAGLRQARSPVRHRRRCPLCAFGWRFRGSAI